MRFAQKIGHQRLHARHVEHHAGRAVGKAAEIDERFDADMSDDFNTALALSDLFGYFK